MAVDPDQKAPTLAQDIVLPPWLERYRWPLVGGVAAVALVVLGMGWVKSGTTRANEDAFQRLMGSQSANDLMAVSAEYPESAAAPLALMKLAKAQYDQGSFEEALKSYESFSMQYREHPLAEGAELGRLHCMEAMGRTEDALKGFEDFQKGLHYLTPQAVIAQGRCLRALGRTDDARVVYEDFITANPSSAWTPRLKELLDEVTAKDDDKAEEANADVAGAAPMAAVIGEAAAVTDKPVVAEVTEEAEIAEEAPASKP